MIWGIGFVKMFNMPIAKKLIKYLAKTKIKYEPILHKTVFTAYDKASTLKLPLKTIGKTLILKTDKSLALALIPANKNLDKAKIKKLINGQRKKENQKAVKEVGFASEKLMNNNFKGMKPGAIPPFGNVWDFPTFIDKGLLFQPKIIVNGGDYKCSIKISPAEMKKAVSSQLVIGNFSQLKK